MTGQRKREGFSFLELQVAFVVLAVALAGLFPLVVMHSKQQTRLEQRLDPQTTYFLVPSTDSWARKLGCAALFRTQDPGPPPPPPLLLLDNGDTAYSEVGADWGTEAQPQAYRGDHRWHTLGTGTNTASWQFTGLDPGWYDVRATWLESGTGASNAPFTVYDGTTNRGTFRVNQQLAPSGAVYDGRPWQSLGVVSIAGSSCKVTLTDDADGRVIADAVRLVPLRNVVSVLALDRTLTGEVVTASVSVTVLVPQ